MFDVPKTFRIKNCIFVEKVYTSAVEKLDQSNDFQAAMEITTNLQLEGMPDKDKAQVSIQSNDVRTLISNSERSMIDEAMI